MLHTACEAAPAQAEPLQRRALQTGSGIDKWRLFFPRLFDRK